MKKLLMDAGFSEKEAVLYIALLKIGEATVDECAKVSGVKRTTAYGIMRKFVDIGLISEVVGKPIRFYCLPPKQAIDTFIDFRKQAIEQMYISQMNEIKYKRKNDLKYITDKLPSLVNELVEQSENLYTQHSEMIEAEHEIMILRGAKNIENTLLLVEKKTAKHVRVFSKFPIVYRRRESVDREIQEYVEKHPNNDIRMQLICETKMLESKDYLDLVKFRSQFGYQFRHLPSLPVKMYIADEFATFIITKYNSNPKNTIALLIQNKDLVRFHIEAFDVLWETAKTISL
ncbi:hypothetical protein J7L68_07185 [bacterium]|nr:hypothetical protein [bacterium]